MFRDLAPGVRTSETLGWIVPKGAEQPGGDEGGRTERDTPAFVRLISHWSGLRRSDVRGRFEVVVHPNRPRITLAETRRIEAGKTDLLRALAGWLPTELKTRILVGSVPGISRLAHLRHLLTYPYGCIEQTSSQLLPLTRLEALLLLLGHEVTPAEIRNRVQAGVARLVSIQTGDGGFAYWPGAMSSDEWGSVYATFVLLEAREAGDTVPAGVLDGALGYLDDSGGQSPFALLVLALAGKVGPTWTPQRIAQRAARASGEDFLWEAGALHFLGRTAAAATLLERARSLPPSGADRELGGRYWSALRELGVGLFVAETLCPGTQAGAIRVDLAVAESGGEQEKGEAE